MKTTLSLLFSLAVLSTALAAPQTFDFKDPKNVNNAVFHLDAPLEAINGSASGISGSVSFDPANLGATRGKIVVTTASMTVPNPVMQEHLLGAQWMDAAQFPEITFEAETLKNVKTQGDTTTAELTGKFTAKGVSKEITVPIRLTYLKDKLGQRVPSQKGDLLVIRAEFVIKRTDYGINPKAPEEKVSNEIRLTLSIAGAAPKP